jgi:hypothetical protein
VPGFSSLNLACSRVNCFTSNSTRASWTDHTALYHPTVIHLFCSFARNHRRMASTISVLFLALFLLATALFPPIPRCTLSSTPHSVEGGLVRISQAVHLLIRIIRDWNSELYLSGKRRSLLHSAICESLTEQQHIHDCRLQREQPLAPY